MAIILRHQSFSELNSKTCWLTWNLLVGGKKNVTEWAFCDAREQINLHAHEISDRPNILLGTSISFSHFPTLTLDTVSNAFSRSMKARKRFLCYCLFSVIYLSVKMWFWVLLSDLNPFCDSANSSTNICFNLLFIICSYVFRVLFNA